MLQSVSGMVTGFAMQRLEPLPDEWSQWEEGLRLKAYECLLTLATSAGIIHNDVRPCNFGLLNGDKVLAIDLEDVKECSQGDRRTLNSFKASIRYLLPIVRSPGLGAMG